jgi:hypothetical protein
VDQRLLVHVANNAMESRPDMRLTL